VREERGQASVEWIGLVLLVALALCRSSRGGELPVLHPRFPGRHMRERSSTGEGLRLVPLEPLPGKSHYRPLAKEVKPPWKKRPYRHPTTNSS
jgi:hypothetical protein